MTEAQPTDPPPAAPTVADRLRAIARMDVLPFLRGTVTWLIRITVPLITLNVMLRALPFRATVAGVPFRVQASLFTRQGLSADTTLGNWEFPNFDGLPIGVHISPVDVDVLRLSRAANPDTAAYVEQLRSGFADQVPLIVLWLAGVTVLGIGIGLVSTALLSMAVRYLRAQPRRPDEFRLRARQFAAAALVTALVGGYGVASFNPQWSKQSRLTGSLAAFQLFPSQLQNFYGRQSKVYDVLGAVVGIQAALQAKVDQAKTPDTSFNIMFVSDLHLAAVYPLVLQYVENFDVKLIVNTGDESEFGSAAELTPAYLTSLRRVTAKAPMIWLAGNHDSPDTVRIMRSVPGVTVLGTKTRGADGGFAVTGGQVNAYGLQIGAVGDPRVYGAPGAFGADVDSVTDPLERQAVDTAVADIGRDRSFDIMATHEPVQARELAKKLDGRIRQVNSGHTHQQNKTSDIQSKSLINLVEGSTGAGGLDNINKNDTPPPIEFSIESVALSCQFTKLLRFQVADPALPANPSAVSVRDDVSMASVYLAPQRVAAERTCDTAQGIGAAAPLG